MCVWGGAYEVERSFFSCPWPPCKRQRLREELHNCSVTVVRGMNECGAAPLHIEGEDHTILAIRKGITRGKQIKGSER